MAQKNWWERYGGNPLVLALAGVLTAAISATISHYLTKWNMLAEQEVQRMRDLELKRLEFKQLAYTDFLSGQTLYRQAVAKQQEADKLKDTPNGPTLLEQAAAKKRESDPIIDSARLRIILLGSNKVLCAMAEYWASTNQFKECSDVGEKIKDAAIYRNMRREFFQTLGAADSPEIDDNILVPNLRSCVLPNVKLDQVCKQL